MELPIALEAGEVESVYLLGRLYHGDPRADPEDHARGVCHLGEIRMKLEWTYLRTERSRRTRFSNTVGTVARRRVHRSRGHRYWGPR